MIEPISSFRKDKSQNKVLKVTFESYFNTPTNQEKIQKATTLKNIQEESNVKNDLLTKKNVKKLRRKGSQKEIKIFQDNFLKEKIRCIEPPKRPQSSEIGKITKSIDNLTIDLKSKFISFNNASIDFDYNTQINKSQEQSDIQNLSKNSKPKSKVSSRSPQKPNNEEAFSKRLSYGQQDLQRNSQEYVSNRFICNKTPLKQKIEDKLAILKKFSKKNFIKDIQNNKNKPLFYNQHSNKNQQVNQNFSIFTSKFNPKANKFEFQANKEENHQISQAAYASNGLYNQYLHNSLDRNISNEKKPGLYHTNLNRHLTLGKNSVDKKPLAIFTRNQNEVSKDMNKSLNIGGVDCSASYESNNGNLQEHRKKKDLKVIEGYRTDRNNYQLQPQNDDKSRFNNYFNSYRMNKPKNIISPCMNLYKNHNKTNSPQRILNHTPKTPLQQYQKSFVDLDQNNTNMQKTATNDYVTKFLNTMYTKKLQNVMSSSISERKNNNRDYTRTFQDKVRNKQSLAKSARMQNCVDTKVLNKNDYIPEDLFYKRKFIDKSRLYNSKNFN